MSVIDIHHSHGLPDSEARAAVQKVADGLAERFGVDSSWRGDVLDLNHAGVEGSIAVLPGEVHVSARLGFLFAAMRGPVEAGIRRALEKHLG